MNKKLDIYYKSQSAKSLDDCLKIYSGYVTDIKQNINTLSVTAEDRTELTLNKEVPSRHTGVDLPDKHKNKLIPIIYGVVDRCPLIYDSSTQDDYYAITDDREMLSVSAPKIFTNEAYLEISEDTPLLEYNKQDTALANCVKPQYVIDEVENKIIFTKHTNTTGSILGGDIAVDGSPISFNLVEVVQLSDVIYRGGTYQVYWKYNEPMYQPALDLGGEFANEVSEGSHTNPINMTTDPEGFYQSSQVNGSFFTIDNYGGFTQFVEETESHLWGSNDNVYRESTDPALSTANKNYFVISGGLQGNNLLTFEADTFCSQSDVLEEIETSYADGEEKPIISMFTILYNMDINVEVLNETPQASMFMQSRNRPNFPVIYGSNVADFLKLSDETPVETVVGESQNPFTLSTINFERYQHSLADPLNNNIMEGYPDLTKNISQNTFQISNLSFGGSAGTLAFFNGGNAIDSLQINNLQSYRRAILKDFDSYDLYAKCEGRVDDINGRYTGTELTVLSGESDIAIRQEQGISSKRLASTSRAKSRGIASKTTKKSTKKIIRGGY